MPPPAESSFAMMLLHTLSLRAIARQATLLAPPPPYCQRYFRYAITCCHAMILLLRYSRCWPLFIVICFHAPRRLSPAYATRYAMLR